LIEFTNGSLVPLQLWDSISPEQNFEIQVKDTLGRDAPLTKVGRALRELPRHGSGREFVLAPGESYETEVDVSTIYAITTPGTYSIQESRGLRGMSLRSNRLEIRLIEPAIGAVHARPVTPTKARDF
jgi:hypothetical protein